MYKYRRTCPKVHLVSQSANSAIGEKCYIITPLKSKIGDTIVSSNEAEIKAGNTLAINLIPVGSLIHNIELKAKGGAKLVRSAGCYATVSSQRNHTI